MKNENQKTTLTHNVNYAYQVESAKRQAVVDNNDPVVNIDITPSCLKVRIEDTEFYQLIIPFIIWMKLFGGFFSQGAEKAVEGSSKPSTSSILQQRSNKATWFLEVGWRLLSRYDRLWSLILGVGLWFTTLISFGVLVYFIPVLTYEVIFLSSYVTSCMVLACVGCVVYYRFNNNGKMLCLFQKYSSLEISVRDKNILNAKIQTACKLITMMCFTGNVIIILGWSYILSTSHGEKSLTRALDLALELFPSPMNKILYYIYFISAVGFTNMLCMQPSFIVLLSVIISIILRQFNGSFKSDSHNNGNTWTENLIVSLHSKFQRIVEMVEDFDNGIGVYIIPFLVILISNLTLITYFLLFLCANDYTKGIFFTWFLILIGTGTAVLLPAAMINEMAMKSHKTLHKIDLSNLTSRAAVKFFMLMDSVNRPIGITATGFLTITKSFIISLVATFFSYFFLLIEFSPSSSMCEDTNSTEELH